jgi:hypothetical protein
MGVSGYTIAVAASEEQGEGGMGNQELRMHNTLWEQFVLGYTDFTDSGVHGSLVISPMMSSTEITEVTENECFSYSSSSVSSVNSVDKQDESICEILP